MLRLKSSVFVFALIAALSAVAAAQQEDDYAPAPLQPTPTPVAAPARPAGAPRPGGKRERNVTFGTRGGRASEWAGAGI